MLNLISTFIGTVITTASGVVFVKYILKEPIKTKKFYVVLTIILNSVLTEILYILNFMSPKAVIGFILYFLLFKITFRMDNRKTIITTIIFYLLLCAGEISSLIIITNLIKINGTNVYLQYGGTILGNLCVTITAILYGYILRIFLKKLVNIKFKKTFLAYLIWSCFLILILIIAVTIDSKLNIKAFLILGVAAMILLTVFIYMKQTYQHHELTLKYDKLLEFIKKYELEIDKQRILRHETKNQFVIIKSKIIDKDKESNIIDYINEIIEDNNQKINNSEYAKLGYLPSNGIKGLFYFKVSEANDRGIETKININKKISNSFLNELSSNTFNQLGKVLGIFLDNAIEGAEQSDDKQLGIEVYFNKDEATFIISNTYTVSNSISINRRSTKGLNRGHGLLLAKQIINMNSKLQNETEVTDNIYIQKLTIKK